MFTSLSPHLYLQFRLAHFNNISHLPFDSLIVDTLVVFCSGI